MPFYSGWILALTVVATFRVASARINDAVLFGDSYIDQSLALGSILNGTYPGKDYQEAATAADAASNGLFFYLVFYGNYAIWNYAVSATVCPNTLTPPRITLVVPDVASDEQACTNNVGINHFVTNDQSSDVSLPTSQTASWMCPARSIPWRAHFIANLHIPLQLTGLLPVRGWSSITYYPSPPRNGRAWNLEMTNLVHSLSRMLRSGVRALGAQWRAGGACSGSTLRRPLLTLMMLAVGIDYYLAASRTSNATSSSRSPTDAHITDTITGQLIDKDSRNLETTYAILSHTWDAEGEQTYQELREI
ncbi:hypothetical protein V8D89_000329 [Ganoderma adspersum]